MRRRAFTMIELLVVLAIVGVILAILLPAAQGARDAARRVQCKNNLKQLGLALHNYHDAYKSLPSGYVFGAEGEGGPGFGWVAVLLPYLDQKPLSEQIEWTSPVWSEANATWRTTIISTLVCPADPPSGHGLLQLGQDEFATTNYVASFGPDGLESRPAVCRGVFGRNTKTRFAFIEDGLSHTFFVGERNNGPFVRKHASAPAFHYATTWPGVVPNWPDAPGENPHLVLFQARHVPHSPKSDVQDASSPHPGGTHFLLGDGSVHFLSHSTDLGVYQALSTRAGGEMSARF